MVENGFCWSCQELMPEGPGSALDYVWIDQDTSLPVCRKCWMEMPIADRVRIAQNFRDRGQDGMLIADVLTWVRGLLSESSLEGTLPPWLRSGDNIDN